MPYHMELTKPDADILTLIVNQGIDSRLQAVTDSTFVINGHRLICDIAPNDLRVIVRRLLETGGDEEHSLAIDICCTLGIEEIWLAIGDRFYVSLEEDEKYDHMDLRYVGIFDDSYWVDLFAVNGIK